MLCNAMLRHVSSRGHTARQRGRRRWGWRRSGPGHGLAGVCDLPHGRERGGGIPLPPYVHVHHLCGGATLSEQQVSHVQAPRQHATQVGACHFSAPSLLLCLPVCVSAFLTAYKKRNMSNLALLYHVF